MVDSYFQRFGFCERQIAIPSPSDLGLVVVIPCFNEPDLIGSLESLWQCHRPACAVEVIVVINSASNHSEAIRSQNQRTFAQATQWAAQRSEAAFAFHLLHFPDLPPKQAGVGLARKIGMDEAACRFDDALNPGGIIVGFDADCRCQRNYLTSIERHFQEHKRSPGCSIYFEHPLEGAGPQIDEGIAAYELHLRYYVQGLRYARFPYAYHTIGSSMAVRAEAYRKQGGMNKRQAGEDFYFLQKIMSLGHFTDLTTTTVIPSPRPSERVPFGTGKAVGDYLEEPQIWTYPLEAFLDLKSFLEQVPEFFRLKDAATDKLYTSFPESIRTFLRPDIFEKAMEEIFENTSSETAFRKRFFHWFNGFQAMKFIHHARDHFYGKRSVQNEAAKLLSLKRCGEADAVSVLQLLTIYRRLDRI